MNRLARSTPQSLYRADTTGAGRPPREFVRVARLLLHHHLSLAGLIIVLAVTTVALFAPLIAPYPGDGGAVMRLQERFRPPGRGHWFGTDHLGRDMLSRVLLGTRTSLTAGLAVAGMAMIVGIPVGLIAGLTGGWRDEVVMRVVDVFLAFPALVLAVLISALWGGGLIAAMLAAAFVWWPKYARLMRGEALSIKNRLFIEAARSFGSSPWRIIRRHVLPNAVTPLTIQASLDVGYTIIFAASLGFVGLGAKPPSPEWGLMMSTGRIYMPVYWWLSIFPGLAILLAVLGFNLLGDGVRDILDPRARHRGW